MSRAIVKKNGAAWVDSVRDVDWPGLEGALERTPEVMPEGGHGALGRVLLGLQRLPKAVSLQVLALEVLKILREELSLDRLGLFRFSQSGQWLQGVVGTNQKGQLVDERGVRFRNDPEYARLHREFEQGRAAWGLLDDAPLIVHEEHASKVIGRGWLVTTPVRSSAGPFGVLYNDSALSGHAVSVAKQEVVATTMALMGERLEEAKSRDDFLIPQGLSPLVVEILEALHADPSCSHESLAAKLGVTRQQLGRVFSHELRVSLGDYRNEQRLVLFFRLVDSLERRGKPAQLLDLALESGFGSYAQFHRVFVKKFAQSPKRYLAPEK